MNNALYNIKNGEYNRFCEEQPHNEQCECCDQQCCPCEPSESTELVQSDWNQKDSTLPDYIKHKPTIPTKTSDLTNDSGFITDISGKQDVIEDLDDIRSGAAAGATAYQKPDTGIPSTDLSSAVQVSLGKADTALQEHQSLAELVNTGSYNTVSKKILLKHDNTVLAEIDATAFIKDGMVSSVTINNGYLVITFNTDAGKEPISIALTDIFNPSNYYNKTAVNELLSNKVDKINGKGLSTEDYTTAEKTKLGDLPTSAELTTALAGKANTDVATTSANGLMSKEDKALLDDVGESMTETITDSIVIDDYTTADTSVSSENIQSEGTVSIETVDTSRGINNTIDGVTYTRGIRFSSNGDVFDVDAGGTLVLYLTAIASAEEMTFLKVFFTSADGTIVNQQLKMQGWYDEIIYAHKESVTIPKAGTVSIQWYLGSLLGFVFGYLFRIDLNGSTLINVSDLKDAVSSNTALLGEKANTADLANVATSGSYNDLTDKPTIPDITGKADKVSGATNGNFAALDNNGNLIDSGHKHSDYLTQHQDLSNYIQKSQTAGLLKNDGTVDTTQYTTNTGTITGITMNGQSKGTSGNVDLGTVVTDVSGKEDITPIEAVASGTTAITAQVNTYYEVADEVGTLDITLPTPTDLTKVSMVVVHLTTGTTPAVVIGSTETIDYSAAYDISANKEYEINCLFNGDKWVVADMEVV